MSQVVLKLFCVIGLVAFSLGVSGCNKAALPAEATADGLVDDVMKQYQQFNQMLTKVTDEQSAKEMLPKLDAAYDKILETTKEMGKVNGVRHVTGNLDPQDFEATSERIRQTAVDARKKHQTDYDRIRNDPKIAAVLKPLWDKIAAGPMK